MNIGQEAHYHDPTGTGVTGALDSTVRFVFAGQAMRG
jgi:hypothetical protein